MHPAKVWHNNLEEKLTLQELRERINASGFEWARVQTPSGKHLMLQRRMSGWEMKITEHNGILVFSAYALPGSAGEIHIKSYFLDLAEGYDIFGYEEPTIATAIGNLARKEQGANPHAGLLRIISNIEFALTHADTDALKVEEARKHLSDLQHYLAKGQDN